MVLSRPTVRKLCLPRFILARRAAAPSATQSAAHQHRSLHQPSQQHCSSARRAKGPPAAPQLCPQRKSPVCRAEFPSTAPRPPGASPAAQLPCPHAAQQPHPHHRSPAHRAEAPSAAQKPRNSSTRRRGPPRPPAAQQTRQHHRCPVRHAADPLAVQLPRPPRSSPPPRPASVPPPSPPNRPASSAPLGFPRWPASPPPLPPPARLGPFSPRAARPPPWSLPSTSLVLSLNHTNLIYSTATQVLPTPPLPPPPPPARVAFATAVAVPARAVAADSGPGGEGEGCVSLHGWAAPGGPRRRVPSGGAACRDEH